MQNRHASPSRLLPWIVRRGRVFGRNQRAAVAVEFALLALPFFTIIAAILETALVFFAGQILESAVHDSSRLLRTGQAQAAEFDAGDYRNAICDGLYGLFDCDSERMLVKVTVLDEFGAASAAIAAPVSAGCSTDPDACDWAIEEAYDPGVGASVVIVQAYYKWPTLVDLPWFNLADQAGGDRLLAGVRVFRNEPFS
jgi:hypothetical protein